MPSCKVPSCRNNSRNGKRLFQLPKNTEIREKWCEFLIENGAENIYSYSTICEDHFYTDELDMRHKIPCLIVEQLEVSSEIINIFEINQYNLNFYMIMLPGG